MIITDIQAILNQKSATRKQRTEAGAFSPERLKSWNEKIVARNFRSFSAHSAANLKAFKDFLLGVTS